MLTAALRDLHLSHPGRYLTDVRTNHPDLWENNPYVTPLSEDDLDVEVIECHYPIIDQSRRAPIHFLSGYSDYLAKKLNLEIYIHRFGGDIHLSEGERKAPSPIVEQLEEDQDYWVVVAGGKYDFSVKWWETERYQEVVDQFDEELQFVQVGNAGDFHPPLRNVIDLRGKTSIRELIRLIYHARGILCPITLLMHLAAAIEKHPDMVARRPCVVIAGGREQPSWASYPNHQYLHTIGMLDCCANTGCWKARVVPLHDERELDDPAGLCLNAVGRNLPKCMDLIGSGQVADIIRKFL